MPGFKLMPGSEVVQPKPLMSWFQAARPQSGSGKSTCRSCKSLPCPNVCYDGYDVMWGPSPKMSWPNPVACFATRSRPMRILVNGDNDRIVAKRRPLPKVKKKNKEERKKETCMGDARGSKCRKKKGMSQKTVSCFPPLSPSLLPAYSLPFRRCLPGQSTSGCTTRICRVSASFREKVFSSVQR
jgi:hypothetical protein